MSAKLRPRIDAHDVQQVLQAVQNLEPTAVGAQVLLMATLSLLTIITFNILRPSNKVIYEPKLKYHSPDKAPPRPSDSFCGWIPPLLHTKEPELLATIGLDAVAFLRFLHLLRSLFAAAATISCGLLIPVDFIYASSTQSERTDVLASMTIRDVDGVRLYAHIGTSYLVTISLLVLVHHNWHALYRLRNHWFRTPSYQRSLYARTICISNIPARKQSDEGLYSIVHGFRPPYPFTSAYMARKVGDLPRLIKEHNDGVVEFEEFLVKYLKGNRLPPRRPRIRVGAWCGIGGTQRDAIAYYTAKLKHTEATAQQYRAQINLHQAESYGFASMSSIPAAHSAACELNGKHPRGMVLELAPHPGDIIWENMGKSRENLNFRKFTGFALLILFCSLSLVPLFLVATLANLDSITASGFLPFLRRWATSSPTTYSVLSGILPPAMAAILNQFLPTLMQWLSKYMGAMTYSELDRVVVARYFAFLLTSQLIIFTVVGVVVNAILEIVIAVQAKGANLNSIFRNISALPGSVTRTYVDQSSFWLKWFPMRGFLIVSELAQIPNLIWVSFKTRVFGRTPRDIREWTKPPTFSYAVHSSNLLFMAAVGLVFAPLAPLVTLAACAVFWLSSWVHKYQLMFVFATNVESGGRLWNVIINRLLISAMLMQIILVLTIGFQAHFISLQCLATIPPLFLIVFFKHYLNKRFVKDFQYYIPRQEELSQAIVHSMESDTGARKLGARYGHPALDVELFSPMVHAQMIHLLQQIYQGKVSRSDYLTRGIATTAREKSEETDAVVMQGIVINPITEDQLEYDPMLYQRDREALEHDGDLPSPSSSENGSHHVYPPNSQSSHADSMLQMQQRAPHSIPPSSLADRLRVLETPERQRREHVHLFGAGEDPSDQTFEHDRRPSQNRQTASADRPRGGISRHHQGSTHSARRGRSRVEAAADMYLRSESAYGGLTERSRG